MTTKDTAARSDAAARRLYDAEVAFHIARQSGVDHWIRAAADRLHGAIEARRRTVTEDSSAA